MTYEQSPVGRGNRYRAVFEDRYVLGPALTASLISSLGSFFDIGNFVEIAEQVNKTGSRDDFPDLVWSVGFDLEQYSVVRGVSVGVPLEVVLEVSDGNIDGIGTVRVTGRRVLDLFERYQTKRREQAESRLREAAFQVIEEKLKTLTVRQRLFVLSQEGSLAGAISCMLELRSLQRVEDREAQSE